MGSTSPADGSLIGTSGLSNTLGLSPPSLLDPAPLSPVTPIGFSSNPPDFSSAMPGAFTGLSSSFGPPPASEPIAAPAPVSLPPSLPPSQEFSPGDINPVTNNVVTDVTPRGEIVQEAPAVAAPVAPIATDAAADTTSPALFDPTPMAQQPVTLETPTPSAALLDPAALGGVVTTVADPPAPAQIGYGDRPLGVPVSEISRLTDASAAAFVDERLAEYRNATDRAAKNQALDRALDAAYAWRVQGGDAAPFQRIMDAAAGDTQDALTAQVVRDRADAIAASGIAGNIRALNDNGVNFGAQINELQRAIAQDPDNAYGVIARAYSALRGGTDSGVDMIEMGAFRQAMSGIGYGPEVQDATTNYAARLESDRNGTRRHRPDVARRALLLSRGSVPGYGRPGARRRSRHGRRTRSRADDRLRTVLDQRLGRISARRSATAGAVHAAGGDRLCQRKGRGQQRQPGIAASGPGCLCWAADSRDTAREVRRQSNRPSQ